MKEIIHGNSHFLLICQVLFISLRLDIVCEQFVNDLLIGQHPWMWLLGRLDFADEQFAEPRFTVRVHCASAHGPEKHAWDTPLTITGEVALTWWPAAGQSGLCGQAKQPSLSATRRTKQEGVRTTSDQTRWWTDGGWGGAVAVFSMGILPT
jgi:hypothetical protein